MLTFEFHKDNFPGIFKHWLRDEQARKTGKSIHYIHGVPDATPLL